MGSYTAAMPATPRTRIGVLGGTFDPIHIAHLVVAVEVHHALALDRTILVVAGDPWQKRGAVGAPAADRLEMARAAVAGLDGIEVSALEVERPGPTYTVDTLRALAAPDRDLFLVVGADVAARMTSWHQAGELPDLAELVVVSRDGDIPGPPPGWSGVHHVPVPRLDVSSTELRRRVAAGAPIDGLVPAGAVRVIRERRLYTAQ